jgi:hypothetical protein
MPCHSPEFVEERRQVSEKEYKKILCDLCAFVVDKT